jgi:phage anti-repressor protein/phage antirepressor YoqD-like protein
VQLIQIATRQIAQQSVPTVNARELHTSLEVAKDFSDWVKAQVTRARLVENRDFVVLPQKGENPTGGRPIKEYHLTIDAAKHIAMVSGTDKGFEVREYFIACETRAKEMPTPMTAMDALEDPEMVRGLLLNYATKVIALRKQVAEQAPKVEALDLISTESQGSMCITNAAKDLQVQPKRLFAWLQEHQWIYRRAGGSGFTAYQARIQVGYLEHKVTTVERSDGTVKLVEQVLVTAKGLTKLAAELTMKVAA